MRSKRGLIKTASVIAAFCTLASLFSFQASSLSLDELQQQLKDLEKQQQQIQSSINSIKNDKSKQNQYKLELQKQISNTQSQIDTYRSSISALDAELNAADEEIKKNEAEFEEVKLRFKRRLRDLCMNGGDTSGTVVSVLLGSSDFSEILTMSEYAEKMAAYDNRMLAGISETVKELRERRAELEEKRSVLVSYKDSLSAKEESLKSQITEINSLLSSLGEKETSLSDYYASLEAQERKVQEQIEALARENGSTEFNGSFAWPLPGKRSNYILTSKFNPSRVHPIYGYITPHNGDDYSASGIYGKPIYAAAAGTVKLATNDPGGYGWYVMINHGSYAGKTYATLYAHMTRYVVSAGQTVKQGQLIGYVGESGAATGPHLHLEVRINGTPVSTEPYFK